MTAQIVHIRNIFAPHVAQTQACVEAGLTVCDALDHARFNLPPATVLVRNDAMVKRSDWDALPLAPGETAYLITLPQGGGSSLRSILNTFVQIFAMVVGTIIGGPLGALAAMAISFGGKMLVNAILGPPKPKALPTQSPSYQLTAQRNQARLGGMIPELFGRFIVTPDLVTQPYTFFTGHDQLALRQLFCLGVGEFEIHQLRIGSNVFWEDGALTGTYPEMQVEIVPPGQQVTLFPDNVVQSTDVAQNELLGTNQDGAGYVGPFVANPVDTLAHHLDIDIVMPAGCFSVNDDGDMKSATVVWTVEVQEIDNNGDAVGGWVTKLTDTIHIAFRDPVRRTYGIDVTHGRYQVRVKRTNTRADDINTSDQIYWSAMRAYISDQNITYGDVTLVALSATATKNLNGDNAQQFNAIVTRKLPLYDRETKTWSGLTATRSIAAAASYALRADNGGGLADNRVDLDTLWALEDTWIARGDTFDGIYTDKESLWNVVQEIVQVGRTKRLLAGSLVTFVRDEPKSVPTAGFTPRNILKDSFSIDYLLHDENSVDALVIQYYSDVTWGIAEVFCKLPDSTMTMEEAPRLLMKGITQRDHGFREGMYSVAANRYRRKFPKFRTDLEGRTCFAGSLISVTHWLPKWGTSADAIALEENDAGDILTLSEPYAQPTGTPLLKLLTPDGRVWGPVPVTLLDDGTDTKRARVQLLDTFDVGGKYAGLQPRDWPVWSGDGLQLERPRASIGHGIEVAQDALVVSMKPESGMTATVMAVIEDMRVHEADGTDVPEETNPPSAALVEDLTILAAILKEATTLSGAQYVTVLNGAVAGAPDALSFELRLRWEEDADYSDPIRNLGRTFSTPSAPGSVDAQIRAKGHSGWGAWFDVDPVAATGQSTFVPPALPADEIDDSNPSGSGWVSGQDYIISWAQVPNAIKYQIDIWAKVNAGDTETLRRTKISYGSQWTYTAAMEITDGGPFNNLYAVITPLNATGGGGGGTRTDI